MFVPVPPADNSFTRFVRFLTSLIEKPGDWFRENVVLPNRQVYPWYHEEVRRVPTVDECYSDDKVCIYEADQQFVRDRTVDGNILTILKRRFEACNLYNQPDESVCLPLLDQWQRAQTNFFIKCSPKHFARFTAPSILSGSMKTEESNKYKYSKEMIVLFNVQQWSRIFTAKNQLEDGDLAYYSGSREAYMKQKHRMIWERRHGPVGTGMRDDESHKFKSKKEEKTC